jgi:hypothetical protein
MMTALMMTAPMMMNLILMAIVVVPWVPMLHLPSPGPIIFIIQPLKLVLKIVVPNLKSLHILAQSLKLLSKIPRPRRIILLLQKIMTIILLSQNLINLRSEIFVNRIITRQKLLRNLIHGVLPYHIPFHSISPMRQLI